MSPSSSVPHEWVWIGALPSKQPVQLPHEPRVVSVATRQFEQPHAGREQTLEHTGRARAANRAADEARIQPVDDLHDAEFHPSRLQRKHQVHDVQYALRGTITGGVGRGHDS
jgi:hypothetical protein